MGDALAGAREILDAMQARVDGRDPEALIAFFDHGVLIGASRDGRDAEGLRRYLTVVATQPERLRWDWQEVVPFHESEDSLAFAAFGEIVVASDEGEQRAPIRGTFLAVRGADGWRLRHFHGSIPASS
jgi:hypothetical protein